MALSKEERARDQNNFFFVEKLAKKAEKPVRKEEKTSRKAAKVVSDKEPKARDTSMFELTELSFTNITESLKKQLIVFTKRRFHFKEIFYPNHTKF